MSNNKIRIPAKRARAIGTNVQELIRVTPEAYTALLEVVNETDLSMRQVASTIIIQAVEKGLIEYDRKEE